MQVKYKVNISDKAILNKRTLDRVENELSKRKFIRNILRLVVIGIILVIVIYLIVSGKKEGMRIAENYDNLKANLKDSKHSFDRRVKIFERDADGNIILTDTTLSSLAEATQEEIVGTPSSTPANGAGNFKPVDSGMLNGRPVQNVEASNGTKTIKTYTGVPKEWNATDAEYITVDDSIKAWRAWYTKEFGHDYPHNVTTAFHYEHINGNNYHPYNPTLVRDGNGIAKVGSVDCITIAPPPFWVTNEFRHNCQADSECYQYKFLAIMKNDSGATVYVPMYAADAKGHTWPGGLLQTTIAHPHDDYSGGGFAFDDKSTENNFPANSIGDSTQSMNTALQDFETGEWWSCYYGGKSYNLIKSNPDTYIATFCIEIAVPKGCSDPPQEFGLAGYKLYGIVRCKLKDGEI